MARFRKKIKEYERWILIVIVILILATISVSGVGRGCSRGGGAPDFSGSFLAAPGKRVQVSGGDFVSTLNRYERFLRAFGPSIRYAGLTPAAVRDREAATWMHLASVEAAKAAGYRVGDDELRDGIRAFVGQAIASMQGSRVGDPTLLFSPEIYDRLVANRYGGPKTEFEATFREVLLKDKLFGPLIDSARLSKPREEIFEGWKASRERVDLAWVAVPSAPFSEKARLQEETRSRISEQELLLRRVAAAAQKVRSALAFVETVWKPAHGGAIPKDAAELQAKEEGRQPFELEKDAWDRPLTYEVRDGAPWFSSAGPNPADPADDVTPALEKQLEALASLRTVGDALVQWHGAAKEFPASLDLLKTAPPSTGGARTVPPMNDVPADPWGKPLVYEREGPVLLSSGPDGQRGTPDDLRAEVTPEKAVVPLPASLEAFRLPSGADAWGRPLDVRLRGSAPWRFDVSSAGPDGKPGTEDDVRTGNADEVAAYFQRERPKHRTKLRRSIEAVWVLFPRVSDEIFQAAWAKFPEYRPKEAPGDDQAFDRFKNQMETYYKVYETGADGRRVTDKDGKPVLADPADAKNGHGASVVDAGKKAWLVPAPETLGDRKDVEIRTDDPLHRIYVEKGWRRILLREQFFEAMLNDWLKRARESQAAHEKWANGDKKEPEPKVETFPSLLASVADLRPGSADEEAGVRFLEYVKTEPLEKTEWESLPTAPAFDAQVSLKLQPLTKDGEYDSIPVVVRGSAGRVILRNLHLEPDRDRTLEEPGVREAVWPGYVASKAVDLADAELQRVREAAQPPAPAAGATPPPEPPPPKAIEEAVVAVAKERGFPWTSGTTGLFVGNETLAPELRLPPDATEEQKAALRAAHVVRTRGYSTVRSTASGPEGGLRVGTIGRTTIRDDGEGSTNAAYLVQVRHREDAPPEEFSGEPYKRWLLQNAYAFGERGRASGAEGFVSAQIARYFEDFAEFSRIFDLKTARKIAPEPTRRPVELPRRP